MASLTQSPSHVSLKDSGASPEEIDAIRGWMMSDAIPDDETPTLDLFRYFEPDDFPPRRPGVPRGPQPRREVAPGVPIDDADILLATGSVG